MVSRRQDCWAARYTDAGNRLRPNSPTKICPGVLLRLPDIFLVRANQIFSKPVRFKAVCWQRCYWHILDESCLSRPALIVWGLDLPCQKKSLSIEPSRLMLGARTSSSAQRASARSDFKGTAGNQIRAARSVRTRTSALPATCDLFQMPTTFWAKPS